MLSRLPGESDYQYHRRLIMGKLVDHTLADVDYSELSVPLYGKPLSSDATRKAMYGSRDTIELMEKERIASAVSSGDVVMSEIDAKMLDLRKEQQKMFDQRMALNQVIRERARAEELNDIIRSAISAGQLPPLPDPDLSRRPVLFKDNDLLISLNDIHYGAVVDNYWCKYNPEICKQMMEKYLGDIARIAQHHNMVILT